MAHITIDDLEQDLDLDNQAMVAIFGGRRSAGSMIRATAGPSVRGMRFAESELVPELIKVEDLRQLR